jgi:hypothetical protein
MWVHERTEIIEPIGCHQAGCHELPQPVLHLCLKMTGESHQIGEEAGALLL